MGKKNKIIVSIIIATKNEEKNIARSLKSLRNQAFPKESVELIIVDCNSRDNTSQIAKKFTTKVFTLSNGKNLKKFKNFRGAQINLGVKKSRGKIIFFPDADMTFDPKLIKNIVALIKNNSLDALYIPEIIIGKGLLGKIRNFERSFYNLTPIDGIRAVKKEIFLKVKGFDARNIRFGPDDWDFTKRVKEITKKIGITSNKLYHHEEELNLKTYLIKKHKYSNTFHEYVEKWGVNDPDIKKQLGIGYRFFGVFVEQNKWKRLVAHPLLSSLMYLLKFAVGIGYFHQSSLNRK